MAYKQLEEKLINNELTGSTSVDPTVKLILPE
jgi:hypothetical protein